MKALLSGGGACSYSLFLKAVIMRSHLQPGLVAGADSTRFVSKHWGWLRALLVLCLLFAVGATETEEIRFQTRQSKRPMRVRQSRHNHAGRRAVSQATVDATSGDSWEAASVCSAWNGSLAADSFTPHGSAAGRSITGQADAPRLLLVGRLPLAAPPGCVISPASRTDSSRAPPDSLL